MKTIHFDFNNPSCLSEKQKEVSLNIVDRLEAKKNFSIIFDDNESKTLQQLRGIHKLCDLLAKRYTETQGRFFSREMAKDSIKFRFNFLRFANKEEAFKEAIKLRAEGLRIGKKMTIKQFNFLVDKLQKTLFVPRSFRDASKEEMMGLIDKIEQFANDMGWHEVKLESKEKQEMINYYEKNGK